MILPLLVFFQLAATDSLPRITLDDALSRAARLDPAYVAARGDASAAEWERRAAWSALLTPSLSATTDASKYSTPTFNLGTGDLSSVAVNARLDARYELFSGGRRLAELGRSAAALEGAHATERQARFDAALRTETDYYEVLAAEELSRVQRDRVQRALEQLVVARARVVSGAAVATDSLQLLLELARARVAGVKQDAAVRVARLQLGRRVGMDGPVEAAPLDSAVPSELPVTLEQAVAEARAGGPRWVSARANERAADAVLRSTRGSYLPQISVGASTAAFDNRFFPSATTRSSVSIQASLPIWDGARREVEVARARAARDAAAAVRLDAERSIARDVTEAFEAYGTARATVLLSADALLVARENYRVQDTRYRAGATTILDLLEAQLGLSQAEADLVQSRHAARLALAGLEALLGRRIFDDRSTP